MPVYIDDQSVELTGQSLGEVLESAQQHLQPQGRIVVEVRLDGESLIGQAVAQHHEKTVEGAEVRLYSANPHILALATLEELRQRLNETTKSQQEAAEFFQQDNAVEGLKKISEGIEVWLQVQQAVLHISNLLRIDLDNMKVADEPVTQLTADLLEKLKELKELITNGDTVGLADVLAYEWPDVSNNWDALLEQLIARVEAMKDQQK